MIYDYRTNANESTVRALGPFQQVDSAGYAINNQLWTPNIRYDFPHEVCALVKRPAILDSLAETWDTPEEDEAWKDL